MINLISDTVTKPCKNMLKAMSEAEVGDDVFREDPTVNKLEDYAAQLFGKEAAIFCPSGTMTNQIAIKINTRPFDEVICDVHSHIYHYENAAYAQHSGVGLSLVSGENGIVSADLIAEAIRPKSDWYPNTSLLVIENTCNKAGGTHYTFDQMAEISGFCKKMQLKVHLDGARIFNALILDDIKPDRVGPLFDTLSICLSKGLGAPVGSLLIGNADDIRLARRVRKAMGGGMRQVGYLAAAGLYALKNNIQSLEDDHRKAKRLKEVLSKMPWVESIRPGETNIVIFDLDSQATNANQFLENLKEKGILCSAFGPYTIRMVTHRDVSVADIVKCGDIMERITY